MPAIPVEELPAFPVFALCFPSGCFFFFLFCTPWNRAKFFSFSAFSVSPLPVLPHCSEEAEWRNVSIFKKFFNKKSYHTMLRGSSAALFDSGAPVAKLMMLPLSEPASSLFTRLSCLCPLFSIWLFFSFLYSLEPCQVLLFLGLFCIPTPCSSPLL